MAAPFVWGDGGARMTPEAITAQRLIAEAMRREGSDYSPVASPWQGGARVVQALLGGYEGYRADQAEKANLAEDEKYIQSRTGGDVPAAAPAAPAMPSQRVPVSQSPVGKVTAALSGRQSDAPVSGMPPDPAITAPARAAVMPSPKVWGDKEAQDAGLYEKPTPQGALSFNDRFAAVTPPGANPVAVEKVTRAMQPQAAPVAPPVQVAQAPQAQPQATGLERVNPADLRTMTSRYSGPQAKAIAKMLVEQQMKRDDYDIQQRPDGTVIAINKKNPSDMRILNAPGAGQSAIDFEAAKAGAIATAKGEAEKKIGHAKRDAEQKQVANVVTQDIDRALDLVEKNPATTTGFAGPYISKIGGTPANDVRALVDTVKANAGFAELQKMRDNSPTGGALGQVSEREIAYLQATIGNMEQSQTADQFKDNLRRVKNAYSDIIHGAGNGPREKLGFQDKKQSGPKAAPQVGHIEQGYRFKGGDPANRNSWEKVN
jgi:hypothetical protein